MPASTRYKDYVLFMLFIKYVSDKYADQPFAAIKIPKNANFKDMVALKGTPVTGDKINTQILGPIGKENRIDFGDLDFRNNTKTLCVG